MLRRCATVFDTKRAALARHRHAHCGHRLHYAGQRRAHCNNVVLVLSNGTNLVLGPAPRTLARPHRNGNKILRREQQTPGEKSAVPTSARNESVRITKPKHNSHCQIPLPVRSSPSLWRGSTDEHAVGDCIKQRHSSTEAHPPVTSCPNVPMSYCNRSTRQEGACGQQAAWQRR